MKRVLFVLIFLGIVCTDLSFSATKKALNTSNRREIIAEVNGEAITENDIEIKTRIIALSMGQQYTKDFAASVRDQVLEILIDDNIKLQEISRIKKLIKRSELVSEKDVSGAISNIAKRARMDDDSFKRMIEKHNIPFETFRKQIFVQIAWNFVIHNMFGHKVEISNDEAAKEQEIMKKQLTKSLYLLSRIYLPIESEEDTKKVRLLAKRICERLLNFQSSFPMLAQQFSRAPEAVNGGGLGWITKDRLSAQEGTIVDSLALNVASEPINTGNAYVILMLHGKKGEGEKHIQKVKIQKVILQAPGGQITSEDEARAVFSEAQKLRERMKPIEKIVDIASTSRNITLGPVETVSLDEMNPQLKNIIEKVEAKSVSNPVLFPQGAIMFIVWGKESHVMAPPSLDEIKNMLTEKRLNMMAEQYFRELKKTAYIKR